MAKRSKKTIEVKKFGGTEDLGSIKELGNDGKFHSYLSNKDFEKKDVNWDAKGIEVSSETNLEQDTGYGKTVIIRNFKFKIDSDVLTKYVVATNSYPDKQMLFNSVLKFIETSLWQDGMKVYPDVEPRVTISDFYTHFDVFVGALPNQGQRVLEKPKTLSEIVNG